MRSKYFFIPLICSMLIISSLVIITVPNANALGYGAKCLNRHNATLAYTLVKAVGTNYTGSGDEQIASSIDGYDVSIFLTVKNYTMPNSVLQPDATNGSIFFASDVFGYWNPHCYYNINFTQYTWVVLQYHPVNLTGYTNGLQTVTLSTGTSLGQYDVMWIG